MASKIKLKIEQDISEGYIPSVVGATTSFFGVSCCGFRVIDMDDMIGRKFGRLTVLGKSKSKKYCYRCLCECGNITNPRKNRLLSGETQSCGCIRILDLTGSHFGRLVVIDMAGKENNKHYSWNCRCICGNLTIVRGSHLIAGKIKSCGCYRDELRIKHNMCNTPTYNSWDCMIQRCLNPNNTNYDNYGGKGVSICERWFNFKHFLEDMGERPLGKSIDRINPQGNYELSNCRWATDFQQNQNQRVKTSNKTGVCGVSFDKRRNKYLAQIVTNGRHRFLGRFNGLSEAIEARHMAEQKYQEK